MNTIDQDLAARWENVAQAAKWLAEGREVEYRPRQSNKANLWIPLSVPTQSKSPVLHANDEYRLKPEPPKAPDREQLVWLLDEARQHVARIQEMLDKHLPAEPPNPREWEIAWNPQFLLWDVVSSPAGSLGEVRRFIRVREVID